MTGQIPPPHSAHLGPTPVHPAHGAFAGPRGGYEPMSQPTRDIRARRMRVANSEADYVRQAEAAFRAVEQRPDASHSGHGAWDTEGSEVPQHLSRLYRE